MLAGNRVERENFVLKRYYERKLAAAIARERAAIAREIADCRVSLEAERIVATVEDPGGSDHFDQRIAVFEGEASRQLAGFDERAAQTLAEFSGRSTPS